jgi:hypothetical protein
MPNRYDIRVENVQINHSGGQRAELRIDIDIPNTDRLRRIDAIHALVNAVGEALALHAAPRWRRVVDRIAQAFK